MSLEDIIRNKWIEWYGEYPVEDFTENMEEIAQAIRDAGYVRIEDLEIDEDKLVGRFVEIFHENVLTMSTTNGFLTKESAKALAHAKDIIKVKESNAD